MVVQRARAQPKLVPQSTAESLAIETHADSMTEVAKALQNVANEMALSREQAKPMHDFFDIAGDALTCMRERAAKWGPWFLASLPLVISLINGASPQAAKLIQGIINIISQVHQ